MKKFAKVLIFLVLAIFLVTGNAMGTTIPASTMSWLEGTYGSGNLSQINDNFDQIWYYQGGQTLSAKFMANMAGYEEKFGFYNGTYNELIDRGTDPFYTTNTYNGGTSFNFRFYIDPYGNSAPGYWSSQESWNTDSMDHRVTFKITGSSGGYNNTIGNYVLLWEDLPPQGIPGLYAADNDYDDLVIELDGANPVPEPATMLLFGTGLIGLVGFGRRNLSI